MSSSASPISLLQPQASSPQPLPQQGSASCSAASAPPAMALEVSEVRPADANLVALCEHIRLEGFAAGAFSDVVVQAMGATYQLHRLVLSRSAYFRTMLHGPWKEAGAPTVILHIDDPNVNSDAIATALAYLYGQPPKLNDSNAFRVLAAASFLDLQDLCALCTDFIISELWTGNFLQYQVFAESQDYGIHGERVRSACWRYLCQCATMELRQVLPKLSSQTLHSLLTSDKLWVQNEEKRFELALYTLFAKAAVCDVEVAEEEFSNSQINLRNCTSSMISRKHSMKDTEEPYVVSIPHYIFDGQEAAEKIVCTSDEVDLQEANAHQSIKIEAQTCGKLEGITFPDEPLNRCFSEDQVKSCFSRKPSSVGVVPCNDWGRCSTPLWGGRVVSRRQTRSISGGTCLSADECDAFINIFEKGSILYCNMSFEALLNARKHLEEFGFPCKDVNDGLWLQMLLCHRVQAVVADTCRNCCLTSNACSCKQAYGYAHGSSPLIYYSQDFDRPGSSGNPGNIYLGEMQGDGSGLFGPLRAHARVDGLAGIGRGNSIASEASWPPTRYVFSRVPFGLGARNGQQPVANDEPEARVDHNFEIPGEGLTALVGLSHDVNTQPDQIGGIYETNIQSNYMGAVSAFNSSSSSAPIVEPKEHSVGSGWETNEDSTISLDLKTPLSHFPPFRFGVEFEDVLRLLDGQVKRSPEAFYAGSLWMVSVQVFNDEDPHGRRTLGLFLHRRKAEMTDSSRKVHMFIDSRDKVTARYQLICPTKREVMTFGVLKQAGTLLPKVPKGWGWRTAILFDELPDLLQGGALRVAAVIQLV